MRFGALGCSSLLGPWPLIPLDGFSWWRFGLYWLLGRWQLCLCRLRLVELLSAHEASDLSTLFVQLLSSAQLLCLLPDCVLCSSDLDNGSSRTYRQHPPLRPAPCRRGGREQSWQEMGLGAGPKGTIELGRSCLLLGTRLTVGDVNAMLTCEERTTRGPARRPSSSSEQRWAPCATLVKPPRLEILRVST